jgi:capsule polysaccharide export protein KpsE/RkpR
MSKPNILKLIEQTKAALKALEANIEELKKIKNGDTIPTNIQPQCDKQPDRVYNSSS